MNQLLPAADTQAARSRSTHAAPSTLSGFAGLAVLAVVLQSSGGFRIELLGPDLVLVATGFALTVALLTGTAGSDPTTARAWYREQAALRAPLLVVTIAAMIAIGALVGQSDHVARTAWQAFAGLWPVGLWELAPPVGRLDRIDPLGALWLIGLVALFGAAWPIVLTWLRKRLRVGDGRRVPTALTPVLVGCAVVTWSIGPIRAATGAELAELAVGGHVRLTEWLFGAAAGAAVIGLRDLRSGVASARWPRVLAVLGGAVLVTMAALATLYPEPWLRLGGPGVAAAGAAAVLLALHGPGLEAPARALARGMPAELGRMAYPLLVLHCPLFWLLQLAVPGARPFALLVIGGALAWLIGLLFQDGLVRRWHRRAIGVPRAVLVGVIAILVAAGTVAFTAPASRLVGAGPDRLPVVLTLGGSTAGDLAGALDRASSRFTVVHGGRPGCGLRAGPPAVGPRARTTGQAQAPVTAPNCADWPAAWRARIAAVQPDAVIVDVSADAVPRGADPCDAAFRRTYRSLVEQGVDVWTEGNPKRPVLLATIPDDGTAAAVRCLNALVTESAGSHRELTRLDVGQQLCPNGACRTHTLDGDPLLAAGARLSPAGLDELGTWLERMVAERLRLDR